MKILKREFYQRKPELVAKELLGKLLVRHWDDVTLIGRIVETEAYSYPNDPASHAYHGITKSNVALFGEVGRAYVYFIYGNHWALNIVAHQPAFAIQRKFGLEGVHHELLEGSTGKHELHRGSDASNASSAHDCLSANGKKS